MGSEMCIRDRYGMVATNKGFLSSSEAILHFGLGAVTSIDSIILRWPDGSYESCLLYTSDAADERSSVDLGGRRIIKKKKQRKNTHGKDLKARAYRRE